jgi:hypothetical protein
MTGKPIAPSVATILDRIPFAEHASELGHALATEAVGLFRDALHDLAAGRPARIGVFAATAADAPTDPRDFHQRRMATYAVLELLPDLLLAAGWHTRSVRDETPPAGYETAWTITGTRDTPPGGAVVVLEPGDDGDPR